MNCELDYEVFTCNKCGGSFGATEGTWLPVGEYMKSPVTQVSGSVLNPPLVPPNGFEKAGSSNI
jgi:hypothetical protein